MQIVQQAFRVYVEIAELESCIRFYEKIQGTGCERRVRITETGIDAAKVGGVLILAGDSKHLDRVKFVQGIYYVDSLDDFAAQLRADGATFFHEPRTVTGGRNFTARHQDGLVMEYFEAAPQKGNRS
jgi:predicted enzyme related to lactoylglutathione lyase